ncbi:antitermination protein [Salmonella enterica]|nr:antitermination protein [Salmonella enterica]EEN3297736.1 antitermination protein [Salmonella enterica]
MRDIHKVLELWGAWVANNHENVVWSHIAAGFKGLIPSKVKFRPQCCDDDAMIICGCMARLNKNNSDLHDLLMDYYVMGMTFMMLARKHGCSDCRIGRLLQKAEGIIDGMLMMLDIRLEME